APAYNINSNLKLGLTLTYNNYLLKNNSNQEDINLAGSVRYAFDNMAVLFLADFDAFNTDDRGLVPVENGIEDTTYRLNFTYYAL
ncbi:MAG: hypothetical protein KDD50_15870, partial [Bdellovibrionales bacterium]|nr:hypothetical protein [Bdellovibrionales bacterium]